MSPSTSTPIKAPKAMSSRLLTMKFMQRAAASPTSSAPSTPDVPSAKRQKTHNSSPSSFDEIFIIDQKVIAAALAQEEAAREAILDREAAKAGDTRWVLSYDESASPSSTERRSNLRVIQTGFSDIDRAGEMRADIEDDVSTDRPVLIGRKSFGKFNKQLERLQNPDADISSSGSEDDEDEDEKHEDDSDDDENTLMIKQESRAAVVKLKADRSAAKKAKKAELRRLAEIRKKKEVQLNDRMPTAISASGADARPASKDTQCFNCNEYGHLKSDCPQTRKRHSDGGQSFRPKKSRKST